MEAYADDPLSYYSNLSGLELIHLGKKPKDWRLPQVDHVETPDWSHYFSADGKVKDPAYNELARIYFLATLGDDIGAGRAFGDLDRVLWQRVLSSSVSAGERRQFAKTVSWLRLALADTVGSLRAAEVARQAFGMDLDAAQWSYLFPLSFWPEINNFSKRDDINPWFVTSLIRQESAFNPHARSAANAIGLMQMIPPVALSEAKLMGQPTLNIQKLNEPAVAVELGVHHLKNLVSSFDGSWICATASYNSGTPPVKRWLGYYSGSTPQSFVERISYTETRNYVKSILRNFVNYQRLYADGSVDFDTLLKMPPLDSDHSVAQRK